MPKTNVHKSGHSAVGKQPLKRFTIAISGYFGEQRSAEQMRQWIHANGGTVASDISTEVTHLVCSKEHFKEDVAMGMISHPYGALEGTNTEDLISPKGAED